MSNQETIESVVQYIQIIDKIKSENEGAGNNAELLFRGQRQDKSLLPKIARLNLNGSLKKVEKLMLDEFRRACVPLAEFQPENNWDLLALAQHHGLPTRLLDWSYSALVALWFAVQNEPAIGDDGQPENGVVWVLCANVTDFRDTQAFEDPLDNKSTKIFRSKVISKRISAQSGAFTVHRILPKDIIVPFEKHGQFSGKLVKLLIPHGSFASIRKSLSLVGINHAQIFPDIDGLCQHLERRFSKLGDEI
ncbi:FRG domain-containing protein [bacterium 19MO03SA05]|uniref:FRG domain-containing protein n=1 Tax=bacterium 19MO03SA05 TaxID=2920620 RepID=A0AAU6VIL4_UNCXX|nr:FRG domain-containing protein [Vibrio metschnikovii]